jgi:hypothetical protein
LTDGAVLRIVVCPSALTHRACPFVSDTFDGTHRCSELDVVSAVAGAFLFPLITLRVFPPSNLVAETAIMGTLQ